MTIQVQSDILAAALFVSGLAFLMVEVLIKWGYLG